VSRLRSDLDGMLKKMKMKFIF